MSTGVAFMHGKVFNRRIMHDALEHRHFSRCKNDAVCSNASVGSVVESFARQVLNKDFDINRKEELVEAVPTYETTISGFNSCKRRILCGPPNRMGSTVPKFHLVLPVKFF